MSKCAETGSELKDCPHKEQLTYLGVVHIPGTKHGRVVRDLGNDLSAAISKLTKLKESVLAGEHEKSNGMTEKKAVTSQLPAVIKPATLQAQGDVTLIEGMSRYLGFLNNADTPKHKQRERSSGYKEDIARAFKYFCGCLKKSGYAVEHFPIAQISDTEVGIFFQFLTEEKEVSPFTYNRYMTYFSSFMSWAMRKGYAGKNVFEDVPRLETHTDSRSITPDNFSRLLELITTENGLQRTPGKKKEVRNVYKPFLKTGYLLGILTGLRTEEIINLSFACISEDCTTIRVEDFKPNRILNRQGTQKQFKYIPITRELRAALENLGYEQHKGTQRHLLAPEITDNRVETIGTALSRSFSHFYKLLNTGEVLTWKCLRKTYLSRLKIFMHKNGGGLDVKDVSNHTNDAILDKHYFDKRLIAASLVDFSVLSNREEEIQRIRKNKTKEEGVDLEQCRQ